ncbi:MAG: DUF2304 domain-containing protein [Bdellovibrionales bacterium]|nr:DUF2304 domain-containing protein [Bdellovibrionales bacterium]
MSSIQIILILGLFGSFLTYLSFFRSILFDRFAALVVFLLLFLAVLFPDSTTTVANMLGVGRGVDLVLYLFAIGTLFCIILLYTQLSKTKQVQTEIIRSIAINTVKKPAGEKR